MRIGRSVHLGSVALPLFQALALMTLELWQIAALALPLTLILAAQVALVAAVSLWLIPRVTGRDYDAAVISSGFWGFMLGTVANSMANMEALVRRYGPAPRRADRRGISDRVHERADHHGRAESREVTGREASPSASGA